MINSQKIANKLTSAIPDSESPEKTQRKQGYFHVDETIGNAEKTILKVLVRDFDYDNAVKRVQFLKCLAQKLEKEYPGSHITVEDNPKYRNMKEKLKEFPEIVEFAKEGIRRTGLQPVEKAIRGGTDGSQLTERGLLTPNMPAGRMNSYSKNEFVSIQDMEKCTANVINTLSVWAEKAKEIAEKIKERREKVSN